VAEIVDALVSWYSGSNVVEFKSPHPHFHIQSQTWLLFLPGVGSPMQAAEPDFDESSSRSPMRSRCGGWEKSANSQKASPRRPSDQITIETSWSRKKLVRNLQQERLKGECWPSIMRICISGRGVYPGVLLEESTWFVRHHSLSDPLNGPARPPSLVRPRFPGLARNPGGQA